MTEIEAKTNDSGIAGTLCKECSLLDIDQIFESGYVLKPSWAALVKSAKDGCPFCKLIKAMAGWEGHEDGMDENEGEDHVYCTIRPKWDTGFLVVQKPTNRNSERPISSIMLTSPKDDPMPNLGVGQPLEQDVQSEGCFTIISNWLKKCREEHLTCSFLRQQHLMPMRLINVESIDSSEDVRLELTEGRLGEWVSLSHCWGGASPVKTTAQTLQSRLERVRWNDLPLTFQEAVKITRKLAFKYLWIDSLCIIQDSQEDWLAHSAVMGTIYRESSLCIAAEMTPNSDAGIFAGANQGRKRLQIKLPYSSPSQKLHGEVWAHYPLRVDMFEWGGPLSRRAWTLQESTMASRLVRYGKEQIYFRCPGGAMGESTPHLARDLYRFDRDHQNIFRSPTVLDTHERLTSWYRIIDDFARRGLTYEADRLPSIAGVATEAQALLGFQYIAGLWLEDIHRGLLWRARGRASPTKQYIAPSWSWASIIVMPWEITDEYDTRRRQDFPIYLRPAQKMVAIGVEATILKVEVRNVVDNLFLQVASAILTVRNYSQPLSSLLLKINDNDFNLVFDSITAADFGAERRILFEFDLEANCHAHAPPFDSKNGIMLFLVAQWTIEYSPGYYRFVSSAGVTQPNWSGKVYYALLLEPTGEDDEFKRIGVAEIPENKFSVEDWVMRTVAIV